MKGFFKDFIIYGFASVLGKIAAIFLLPIYTRVLTREEYGVMAMFISVKGFIDLVSNLNIHSGIARDYCEYGVDRKKLVSTGLWSILSISLSVLIILYLSRIYWQETVLGIHGYDGCLILMLLSVPSGSIMSYFCILTRFRKKPILFSVGTITSLTVQLTIAIITIVVLKKGIIGFFWATLISELVAIVFYGYINRNDFTLKFDFSYLERTLKFCVPLLPAILAGWLDSSLGQIIVGRYVSLTSLGIYSIALQLASVFTLISTALNNVWTPYLYEEYVKPGFDVKIKRMYVFFIIVLMCLSLIISFLSKEIILTLSNPGYIKAAEYITILCFPMSLYLLFNMVSSGINMSRDTKYVSIAYIIGSVLNIVILLILLKYCGVMAVLLGLCISRIVTYIILSRVSELKHAPKLPHYLLIFFAILIAVSYICVRLDIILQYRMIILFFLIGIILYVFNLKYNLMITIRSLIRRKE